MNLEKTLELIKKHGAVAVLTIWIGVVQYQLSQAQSQIVNCYEGRPVASASRQTQEYRFLPKLEAVLNYERKQKNYAKFSETH